MVTEHGALLCLPSRLEIDTLLEVMHCYSEEVGNFRVAHVDGEPKGGQFHIIAEMLTPGMDSGNRIPVQRKQALAINDLLRLSYPPAYPTPICSSSPGSLPPHS